MGCIASACCAGVLCAVLWKRFLQQPAILVLEDGHDNSVTTTLGMPLILFCPPKDLIAHNLFGHVKNESEKTTLTSTLLRVIRRRNVKDSQMEQLDQQLAEIGSNISNALLQYSPNCHELVTACRWQYMQMPSSELFHRHLTEWGVCCILDLDRLLRETSKRLLNQRNEMLDVALNCNNISTFHNCKLVTMYEGEEGMQRVTLLRGQIYNAQLVFSATAKNNAGLLNVASCESKSGYSKRLCKAKCLEEMCGCSDPLRGINPYEENRLPPCPLLRLNCLRSDNRENRTCSCLPSCYNVIADISLQSSSLNTLTYSYDPIYSGLNASTSTVIHLNVLLGRSKTFALLPTESWLTLLSSLGGVFGMFLGVSLFSALEFILFALVKLPIAIKYSARFEIQPYN